jgi:tyrosine-protein kinase Etk/Wzc
LDTGKEGNFDQSRLTYSRTFRTMAVRQLRESRCSAAELGLEIGVHPDTLLSWKREFDAFHADELIDDSSNSVSQSANLQLELERLKLERERIRNSLEDKTNSPHPRPGEGMVGQERALVPAGTLLDILETLFKSRWLILGIVLAIMIAGVGHILIAEPIFRADGLLEVAETRDFGVLEELPSIFREVAPVNSEIEMLRSRIVLGQMVDNLDLTMIVRPVYFPFVGAAIARRMPPETLAAPLLGIEGYAWGGERILIESFTVADKHLDEIFTLVSQEKGKYQLLDQEGTVLINGQAGKFEATQLPDGKPLSLFVSELRASPYTRFEISRVNRLDRINTIRDTLTVREKGDRTRLLEIIFDWPDKEELIAIANEIVQIYVRQNAEKKSGEIGKTIGFLESQLIQMRERVQMHELALNEYRSAKGINDLSSDSRIILEKIINIDRDLSRLKEERLQLSKTIGPRHPRIIGLENQISTLEQEVTNLNWKIKRLPDTQQEFLHLTRDVEVATQLYSSMLNRVEELKIINAGPVGNVRVVDFPAALKDPVKPQVIPLLVLYFGLALSVAVMAAFFFKALHAEVEDPDFLEKRLGYPVYAIIPHSANQDKLSKRNPSASPALLVSKHSRDPASESICSLRTSLHFALLDAKNNIMLITGPGPDIGKSFICANLGAALATAGGRILLIDGDLRRGGLHKNFETPMEPGVSNLISGGCEIKEAIYATGIPNLFLMPTGTIPPNPSELLCHPRLSLALDQLKSQYEYIIMDSSPILPVTDAAVIGHIAGATLLVVKSGAHTLRAIEESLKRLTQAHANVRGFVFNGLAITNGRYGNGKYYGYAAPYTADS